MDLLFTLPAVLIAVVFHEWAHGFASYSLGDPSAKIDGRLSLNPLQHIDPFGFICLLLFHVGWAKPVRINPYMYKNRKLGTALTALAGPMMNFLIAFISVFMLGIIEKLFGFNLTNSVYFLYNIILNIAIINIGLALFNLIPIPPLDGSKILYALLPDAIYNKLLKYERYGSFILIVFILLGLTHFINPLLNDVFYFMYNFVSLFLKIGYV